MIPIEVIPMISYGELYKLLYDKFQATQDEIRYWIKLSFSENNELYPYPSDIPSGFSKGSANYSFANENFLYPEYHFYFVRDAESFLPDPFNRFVYRKDLTGKRNWQETDDRILTLLKRANEIGILRCYDKESDTFTFHAPKNKMAANPLNHPFPGEERLWCHSFENYFNNPDSFFLLYDILALERVFLGKSLEACEKELGFIRE